MDDCLVVLNVYVDSFTNFNHFTYRYIWDFELFYLYLRDNLKPWVKPQWGENYVYHIIVTKSKWK